LGPARPHACAPTDCSGSADGMACAIPGLIAGAGASGYNQVGLLNQEVSGGELVGTECCGGACVDLEQDSSNCGACGVACPTGSACQWGRCQSAVSCAQAAQGTSCHFSSTAEGMCCGGRCVDPGSDNGNCVNCGLTCPLGATCSVQDCILPDGGHVNPDAPSDCGGLNDGSPCGPPSANGEPSGLCCGGTCVDFGNSFAACADCGLDCPPCGFGCSGGTACVDVHEGDSDLGGNCLPLDCGGKGNGDACAFGPRVQFSSSPGPLEGSVGSQWNTAISNTACCSEACVDLSQDPNNCGTCGLTCAAGPCVVIEGLDTCFPSASNDCLESCGPFAVCAFGSCRDSSCDFPPFCTAEDGALGLCCSAPGSPTWCADPTNDPLNCGGCGIACPSGQTCTRGVCNGTPPSCVGRNGAYCNLDAGLSYLCCPGVGCTNVESDDANCGACGNKCLAGTNCQGGSCQ
jgi:hypothetical protein